MAKKEAKEEAKPTEAEAKPEDAAPAEQPAESTEETKEAPAETPKEEPAADAKPAEDAPAEKPAEAAATPEEGAAAPPGNAKGLATAALITGIFLGPVGVVLGILALQKMKASLDKTGSGFAMAGIILGLIGTLGILAYFFFGGA